MTEVFLAKFYERIINVITVLIWCRKTDFVMKISNTNICIVEAIVRLSYDKMSSWKLKPIKSWLKSFPYCIKYLNKNSFSATALILPILGVILHFTMEKFQYIRGGIEEFGVCFLDTPNTLIYLFLTPLYLVICLSLYFFIR